MKKLMSIALALALAVTLAVPISGAGASKDEFPNEPGHYTLSDVTDLFWDNLSGERMLDYDAFVYRGWRTSSGHWLDAVMVDLHDRFIALGFKDSERTTANNQGDSVWFQYDGTTNTWNPQYVSLKVAQSKAEASDPRVKTIEFVADCIDPTSMYYPEHITAEWLIAALNKGEGDPDYLKMQQVNQRVHLPTNAPFFALTDPNKTAGENIAAGTRVAQLVYVGSISGSGANMTNSEGIPASELAGKIILSSTTATNARTYATNVGAIAALGRVSDAANYRMPVIDGVRWYTNYVQFTGAGSYAAPGVGAVPLHVSLDQFGAFTSLLAEGDVFLEIAALGTYDANQPIRCLVAEIQGSVKPEERILVPAHINEPGACDNASGVAMSYELITAMKQLIDSGQLARPERTMTFVWGDEIQMMRRWLARYRDEFNTMKGMVNLDMVGEDPYLTGGIMTVDKTPDPSMVALTYNASSRPFGVDPKFIYRYGNQTYPGQPPLAGRTDYIRTPDVFSVWTSTYNSLPYNNYPGLYLNDMYSQAGFLVEEKSPDFDQILCIHEGGSDNDPFVEATSTYGAPIPALLTNHFPDYVYHSLCDTLDKLSIREFHDVGTTSAATIYQMANAGEYEAADAIDYVMKGWKGRIEFEKANSDGHYNWQMTSPNADPSGYDDTYNRELKAIGDWSRWYIEAVRSAGKYMIGRNIGMPYKLSAALQEKENEAVKIIQEDTIVALNHVDAVFGKDSKARPVQIASANLPNPVFIPVGTTREQLQAQLPAKVTVEYVGGGTGEASIIWDFSKQTSMMPAFSNTRMGLYRAAGELANLGDGVVNWAVVNALAEVNAVHEVIANLSAAEESDIDGDVCYALSLYGAKNVLAVEVEFTVDGNMLAGKGIETFNGFSPVESILWSYAGGGMWKGAVTLAYPAGSDEGFTSGVSTEIAWFIFAPRAKGDATMTLTDIKIAGLVGDATKFLDVIVGSAEATTNIDQRVFSKYDLNKDNKVDALDLGIMLLYCGFDKDSPAWGTLVKVNDSRGGGVTASMCDVNSDGVIDMLDLIDLFIHYTK
ncbi:MAG: M28 family peptidase [Clostridiales bacterium]|nr:M28 family peptidase [Clostridiales bacterium]